MGGATPTRVTLVGVKLTILYPTMSLGSVTFLLFSGHLWLITTMADQGEGPTDFGILLEVTPEGEFRFLFSPFRA